MPQSIKMLLGTIFMVIYGPFLVYLYVFPNEAYIWGGQTGLRKVLFLDRALQPTFFTLGMGVLFSVIALIGMFKFVTTKDDA